MHPGYEAESHSRVRAFEDELYLLAFGVDNILIKT
jgi:hypothetical protein